MTLGERSEQRGLTDIRFLSGWFVVSIMWLSATVTRIHKLAAKVHQSARQCKCKYLIIQMSNVA